MSQYISFFVRKEDNFICLGSFSRNTELYQILASKVPYGKVILLSSQLNNTEETLIKKERELFDKITDYKNIITSISNFNNSPEEKLEQILEYENEIREIKDYIEELKYQINFLHFINDIPYENDNCKIYCGIEVGEISINDIEEN